jgi:2-polyprenyl-3-methyl-5-hydroxy-6-metoxy-1,4-benzoquinol methylase
MNRDDSLDWTRLTRDPNDGTARRAVLRELLSRREIHDDRDLIDVVLERIAGKRVLDVGVVSHTMDYVSREGWRHALLAQRASYCLGIDILAAEVERLRADGYNVRVADATSDEDLGERFDVVFIGDVIEHVDNPVRLLAFGRRHLAPQGVLLAATPNPFSRKFFRRFAREGTMVTNLDHVAWITPSMALELGRRAGLELRRYCLAKRLPPNPVVRMARRAGRLFRPAEMAYPDYLYEFAPAGAAS